MTGLTPAGLTPAGPHTAGRSQSLGLAATPPRLSRRMFLRGAGCALALPLLDAMTPALAAESVAPPLRSAFLYFPNGVWEADWHPTIPEGRSEAPLTADSLPPSLQPLYPVRDDVLVLGGLTKANSREGDGHYAKTANFLTGMRVAKTTGKDLSSGGISIDQLLAQRIGGRTPLPSLELSTDPVVTGIDLAVNYTRLYGSHISWRSESEPVAREINPRRVYERLFHSKGPQDAEAASDNANLLDFVLADARKLRRKVGRDDQQKIDEYLDSVRAVERRIEFASRPDDRRFRPELTAEERAAAAPGIPQNFREHVDAMLDLMVLAFRTDSTRIASFMFARDVSTRNYTFIDGVSEASHHGLSHHENRAEKIRQYALINRWHAARFAALVQKFAAVREGSGTLLDSVVAMCGSSFSDGNRHDPSNLPILVAGRGRGLVRPGRAMRVENTPLCNLYLTLLRGYGFADVPRFGDSVEPLKLA